MIVRRTYKLLAVSLALGLALGGCSAQRKADSARVSKTITVNDSAQNVYYKLTARPPRGTICASDLASHQFYPGQNEFQVYYGIWNWGSRTEFVAAYGKQRGDKTVIEFRDATLFGSPYPELVTNLLTKGACRK